MASFYGPARRVRVTASGNASVTGKGRLVAVHIYGGTAVSSIFDALTQTGTAIFDPTSSAAGSYFFFGDEGVEFTTGLSVTAGAGLTAINLYVKQ